jgi:energy-coupling factor transport system permease protein
MQSAAAVQKKAFSLDPRTKFVLLFFVGYFTFTIPAFPAEIGIFCALALLLALNGQGRTVVKLSVAFAAMVALDAKLLPMVTNTLGFLFSAFVRVVRLVFPIYLAAVLLIRTTAVSEFIAAFRKLRLPDAFIIPVSVMFRFIPTITEEWRSIRNAMRFRGIGISAKAVVKQPMQTLEYMLIPLLMSTATISGELAAASLARGLDSGEPRTCMAQVRMRPLDYAALSGCIVLAITGILGVV